MRRCRCAGLLQRLTPYRIPVVGLELLRSHPLSLRCFQTHGRRFLLAGLPFYWARARRLRMTEQDSLHEAGYGPDDFE
jgi:hypothetical protein